MPPPAPTISPPTTTPAPTPRCSRRSPPRTSGHAGSYGSDPWTERAEDAVPRALRRRRRAPSSSSTAPAPTSPRSTRSPRPFEAVICTDVAHIHVDECGAPEQLAGREAAARSPTADGKLTPDDVGRWEAKRGDEHHVQPRVVSITQATELGTVYSPEEIARDRRRARTRSACTCTSTARGSPTRPPRSTSRSRELTTDAGVDVVSFGGTKNGLVFGEAVVFCSPELGRDFEFTRKQLGQLASKMRFVSAQFEALLTDDLWLRSAAPRQRDGRRLAAAVGADRRGRGPLPGRGQRRLRAPAAAGHRAAAGRAARRAPLLHLGRRPRRGALDVRLGHHRGRRRRVRRPRARGRRRARRARGCGSGACPGPACGR